MIRNLKALGLALAAILALSAVSASGVSAATEPIAKFSCSTYPCSLSGEQPAAEKHEFVTAAGAVECELAIFQSSTISEAATGLTVTPTYEECVLHNALTGTTDPATVTMNGCDYKFTIHYHETKKGAGVKADEYSGDVDIVCPAEKAIEIHVFKAADEEHKEATKCTYHIKEQAVDNIDYKDETSGAIEVTATESPATVKRTVGTFLNCGAENQTAKYSGKVTASVQLEPDGIVTN